MIGVIEQKAPYFGSQKITLLKVNVNVMRGRRKRLMLRQLLFAHRVGVAVVTETLLREAKAVALRVRPYGVVASCCRKAQGEIGAGDLILAHV